jgi:hypothetical protein
MATAPTPSQSAPVSAFLQLNVGAFALACAITAFIAGLVAWPFQAMMWARAARYGVYGPWHGMAGPHAPMMHAGLGAWHLLALVILFVWAGIFGAILAALYNAFVPKR